MRCPDWNLAARIAAENASRGGLFLVTPNPPPLGTAVQLVLELPDGTKLPLNGTVRHVISPERAVEEKRSPGVGVAIDPVHAQELLLLENLARTAGTEAQRVAAGSTSPVAQVRAQASTSPAHARPAPGIETPPVARRPPTAGQAPLARIVGIDFGTTFTSLAVARGDRVEIVADAQGRVLHPSVVHYPDKGPPLVGWAAREFLAKNPRRTVASAKRLLGHSFSDPKVAGYLHSAAYKTIAGPGDSILVDVDGTQRAVTQVCAEIIGHVREMAEARLGTTIDTAVLSCPVTFTEAEKTALKRAAEIAKVKVVATIDEPVAGALAFGVGRELNEIVAVYDFGGGTFDFTVLDVSNDRFRVLVNDGDAWLGGDDFDMAIAKAVADGLWRATSVEVRQRAVEWQRLLFACEEAKRALSDKPATHIVCDALLEQPKRFDLRQPLDRAVLERLCKPLFDRSLAICHNALARVGLDPGDITRVITTGGISRIPFVQAGLSAFFEREITTIVSPEQAIVLGAGLSAAQAAGQPARVHGLEPG